MSESDASSSEDVSSSEIEEGVDQDAPAAAAPSDYGPAALAPPPPKPRFVLLSVLVVATCGLVYELISATMASYLLGDSVTQWSLVIGVYLSSMGLGSYLSKYVEKDVHARFIQIQLVIAIVGGFSDVSGLGYEVSYSEYRNVNEKPFRFSCKWHALMIARLSFTREILLRTVLV